MNQRTTSRDNLLTNQDVPETSRDGREMINLGVLETRNQGVLGMTSQGVLGMTSQSVREMTSQDALVISQVVLGMTSQDGLVTSLPTMVHRGGPRRVLPDVLSDLVMIPQTENSREVPTVSLVGQQGQLSPHAIPLNTQMSLMTISPDALQMMSQFTQEMTDQSALELTNRGGLKATDQGALVTSLVDQEPNLRRVLAATFLERRGLLSRRDMPLNILMNLRTRSQVALKTRNPGVLETNQVVRVISRDAREMTSLVVPEMTNRVVREMTSQDVREISQGVREMTSLVVQEMTSRDVREMINRVVLEMTNRDVREISQGVREMTSLVVPEISQGDPAINHPRIALRQGPQRADPSDLRMNLQTGVDLKVLIVTLLVRPGHL